MDQSKSVGRPSRARKAQVVSLGVALIAGSTLLILALRDDGSAGEALDPGTTIDGLITAEDLGTEHRDDVDIAYDHAPPLGGPHDPEWFACGVYEEPLREENAVHNLEHGAVWITYRPGLPTEDLERLAARLPDDGIMSPYPGLPVPVVMTAWGAQLPLRSADDPRLTEFLETYGDGHTAPEPFASCAGGITDPAGTAR